jgi:hypothetical protein
VDFVEVEPERGGVPLDIRRRPLQIDEQRSLTVLCSGGEVVQSQDRLSGARLTADEIAPIGDESAVEDLVDTGDTS